MITTETLDRIAGDCKRLGITRLKTVDIEMELDLERGARQPIPSASHTTFSVPMTSGYIAPAPVIAENPEAIAKVETLINTLKLPDDQLLDQIFPAGAGG